MGRKALEVLKLGENHGTYPFSITSAQFHAIMKSSEFIQNCLKPFQVSLINYMCFGIMVTTILVTLIFLLYIDKMLKFSSLTVQPSLTGK